MSDHAKAYEVLGDQLASIGMDIESVKSALKSQKIETPSWGYANGGTRFKAFPWPGAATTTQEKIDDAAMVHRMTGIAPSVAIHIPWDRPENDDYAGMSQYAQEQGIRIGAVNPNVFQDEEYRLGSLGNPDAGIRRKALEHILECCEIMTRVDSSLLSLWFADGTNFAGQDSLRGRGQRYEEPFRVIYDHLPKGSRMLIEYKLFEPGFYSTDIADWGMSYAWTLKLGPQAQVLVDLGHHPLGANVEQIVSFLLDEGKLGGFHFNNHKYADDDLIVGSINPYELFLIYNELTGAALSGDQPASATSHNVAFMIDQSHGIEGKMAPMILSVMNCQEAYAKSLLVQRKALAEAQTAGDVLGGHQILNDAYKTDVRPLLVQVRVEMGAPADPIAAYWASGYEGKIREARGVKETSGGYQ